jgi:Pyrimidine reductase, riboflavin biosynthesis
MPFIYKNKEKLKSSTIYVSLEPCSHQGKTPPCTKRIIKFSPKKVFYPMLDYDFRSKGKCKNILKSYKIGVKIFKKYKFGQDFYKYYKNFKEKRVPYLSCKMAISKDFYTKSKKDRWITNQSSRGRVHLLRSQHDCILTSSKTINDDDPSLNCRIRGLEKHSPTRIILDRNLNISLKSKVIKKSKKCQTYIFYNKIKKNKIKLLKKKKIKLIYIAIKSV